MSEEHWHGLNGYTNRGCRCDICRVAHTKHHYEYMQANPHQKEKNKKRQALRNEADRILRKRNYQDWDYWHFKGYRGSKLVAQLRKQRRAEFDEILSQLKAQAQG